MTCKQCSHYQPDEIGGEGQCRRYPPQLLTVPQAHPISGAMQVGIVAFSPRVAADFSCGEFKRAQASDALGIGGPLTGFNPGLIK